MSTVDRPANLKAGLVGAGAVLVLIGGLFGAAAMANARTSDQGPVVTIEPNGAVEKVAPPAVVVPEPVVTPEPEPVVVPEPTPEVVVPVVPADPAPGTYPTAEPGVAPPANSGRVVVEPGSVMPPPPPGTFYVPQYPEEAAPQTP